MSAKEDNIPLLDSDNHVTYGSSEKQSGAQTLNRSLTFLQCLAFVVGALVGSGIFVAPTLVARRTPNSFTAILVWVISGTISLFGALCYTELVSVVRKTGSTYIFVHEAYGKFASFFVMMTVVGILMPTIGNVMVLIMGNYACSLFIEDEDSQEFIWYSKLIGLLLFYVFAFLSSFGVSTNGKIQIFLNIFQMFILLIFIVTGNYNLIKTDNTTNFNIGVMTNNTINGIFTDLPSFGAALFNALYCFDGWYMIAFFIEEIVNPKRNIPLLAFTSLPIITTIYVVVNLSFLTTLSHEEIGSSVIVYSVVLKKISGNTFAKIFPILILVSTGSTALGFLYHTSRFVLSAAREGQLPSIFSLIHSQKRTPIPAVIYVVFATTVSTLIGLDLEKIVHYSNAAIWVEYCIAFSTVIYFRCKRPDVERIYKVWITTPIIMMIIGILLIIFMFIETPFSAIFFGSFIVGCIPIYYVCIHKDYMKCLHIERATNWIALKGNFRYCKVNETNF